MRFLNYLNEGHQAPRVNWNLPPQELAIALINRYNIHHAPLAIREKIKKLEKSFLPENRKKVSLYRETLKILMDKAREELAKMKSLHEGKYEGHTNVEEIAKRYSISRLQELYNNAISKNRKDVAIWYKKALDLKKKKAKKNLHETNDYSNDQMKDHIKTLRKQIEHVRSGNPKDPQLKNLRKQLRDLQMQLKGLD